MCYAFVANLDIIPHGFLNTLEISILTVFWLEKDKAHNYGMISQRATGAYLVLFLTIVICSIFFGICNALSLVVSAPALQLYS